MEENLIKKGILKQEAESKGQEAKLFYGSAPRSQPSALRYNNPDLPLTRKEVHWQRYNFNRKGCQTLYEIYY